MRLLSFLSALLVFVATGAAAEIPPPPPPVSPENVWNLDLSTGGRVSIQLRPDVAPAHVERIKTLTRQGFYDGITFHRVVEGFMAQGGDPTGTGSGGSEFPNIGVEIHGLPHVRGAVGMARTEDPNSANSQFYIMFVPRLGMDQDYTVFGRVIDGMSYVDAIERGQPPLSPTLIVRASIGSDNVPQLSEAELRAAGQRAAAAAAQRQAAALAVASSSSPALGAPAAGAPSATAPAIEQPAAAPAAESTTTDAATPASTAAVPPAAPAAEAPATDVPAADSAADAALTVEPVPEEATEAETPPQPEPESASGATPR